MKASEALERLRPQIEALCARFGVVRLLLFGSAVRDEWNPASSDYDFLAEFGPAPEGIDLFAQQFVFQVEMERLLGRKVDIVDWNAAKRQSFKERAAAEAQEWYAA